MCQQSTVLTLLLVSATFTPRTVLTASALNSGYLSGTVGPTIVGGILREIRPSLCQKRSHLKIRLLSMPCSRASCATLAFGLEASSTI